MIIQLHTPGFVVTVDTDTITDAQLADLNITRESLTKLIPRDFGKEIDQLKANVASIKGV